MIAISKNAQFHSYFPTNFLLNTIIDDINHLDDVHFLEIMKKVRTLSLAFALSCSKYLFLVLAVDTNHLEPWYFAQTVQCVAVLYRASLGMPLQTDHVSHPK